MTRIQEGPPALQPRLGHAKPKTKRTPWLAHATKRSWCCLCPGEGPPKARKQSKTFHHKPSNRPAQLRQPVSSGEGGSAPRILPVPSFGPVSEARAFPKVEDAIDFRHWR